MAEQKGSTTKELQRALKKAIAQKAKPGVWTAALTARKKSITPPLPDTKKPKAQQRIKAKTIADGIAQKSKDAIERWDPKKGGGNSPSSPHRKRKSGDKKLGKGNAKTQVKAPQAVRPAPPPPKPVNFAVDRFIAELPKRSMAELQQQWINVISKLSVSQRVDFIRFREAVMVEWGRRLKTAQDNPDHFDWPSTDPGSGDGTLRAGRWHNEGMLSYLGYRVGRVQGVNDRTRRQILDAVFSGFLPPVNGMAYVKQWGEPATASRLKKLAQELAAFAVNAKRRKSTDLSSAIAAWEDDLKYLHKKYYVGKFGFGWPKTL